MVNLASIWQLFVLWVVNFQRLADCDAMLLGMEASVRGGAAVHPRRTLRKFLFDDHYQSDSRHSHITIVIHTSMSVLKGLKGPNVVKIQKNTKRYRKFQ